LAVESVQNSDQKLTVLREIGLGLTGTKSVQMSLIFSRKNRNFHILQRVKLAPTVTSHVLVTG